MNQPDPKPADRAAEELAAARATNQRLNLRAQRLESELAAYRRAVAQWEISEQGTYVPLRTLAAIAKAAGLDVPARWELHHERVKRLEDELRRLAAENQPAAVSAVVSPPTSRADLRDRIAEALYPTYGQEDRNRSVAIADAVLAVLPEPTGQAAVLLWAADKLDAMLAQVFADWPSEPKDSPGARSWREAVGELRRLAAKAQQQPDTEKPWASDGARIGRALIWSWTEVGRGEFARGYRAAQEEARALLTGQRETAPAEQQPAAADDDEA